MPYIFKSLHLKRRVAQLQELKYCKLDHYLEMVLVINLLNDSCNNETIFKIYRITFPLILVKLLKINMLYSSYQ